MRSRSPFTALFFPNFEMRLQLHKILYCIFDTKQISFLLFDLTYSQLYEYAAMSQQ